MEPFPQVSNSEIGINDFNQVYTRLQTLAHKWQSISTCFHLKRDTVLKIETNNYNDCEKCLEKALDCWLRKDYNYLSYGNPSWRKVCVAAKEGGGDPALAEEIAKEHLSKIQSTTNPIVTNEPVQQQAMSPLSTDSSTSSEMINKDHLKSHYVPPIHPLNRAEILEVSQKLEELQCNFEDNLYETKKCFKQHADQLPNIIEYIEGHLRSLLGPKLPDDRQPIQDEFHDITTIPELFTILEKYTSWFNYEFIVKLVQIFLRDNLELQRTWSTYAQKLKDYFINCGGLTKEYTVTFGLSDIPDTQVMVAKVDRNDYTLADLLIFHRQIPKALLVPNMRLYFCSITPGSLHLNYLIPNYLVSLLFPLTNEQLQLLANIGITELTCGEYTTNKITVPKELPPVIVDINDPLWYENTSTPLHEACWKGLIDEVRWLIDTFGYKIFQRGLNGWTPLHSAAYGGHIDVLQLLINQYKCDPTVGDDDSVTSLHMAGYKGHLDIVKYLIDTCGVHPDKVDSSHTTALLYSAMGGHCDTAEFLINMKCNFLHLNCCGASLSLLACKSGQLAIVHKLEALNLFSLDSKDNDDCGILHYACMSDSKELVQYLLIRYKQLIIKMKDRNGLTLLHYASCFASSAVISYIISIRGKEALLEVDNECISSLHHLSDSFTFIKAGIIFSKLYAPCDALFLQTINGSFVQTNIDIIKRQERICLLSSLLKQASTCSNFNINATTTNGRSLFHLASLSGSTLLVKTLEKYNISVTLLDYHDSSPVHCAALSGSLSVLSYIVNKYESLSATQPDYDGHTPLHCACMSGSINTVDYLINTHHSDPNITDNNGMNSLHWSCFHGHYDLIQHLIEVHHTDIRSVDKEGRTVLHFGAYSGNLDLVEYLINKHDLSPIAVDNTGRTPLHYATFTLKLPLVKELITTYKLNPHQSDSQGRLPIHDVAEAGDIIMLEYLVQSCKCSLTLTDNRGWNITHFSTFNGRLHFIKHLDINSYRSEFELLKHRSTDYQGQMPLHFACQSGNSLLVKFLINDINCDVWDVDSEGSSCITYACYSGNLDLVQLLVDEYRLDSLPSNNNGYTSLHASVQEGHIHIMEWISQKCLGGVDIASHCNKYTLVHTAAYHGQLHALKVLINTYRSDINAITNTGATPLHEACAGGHVAVVRYLTSLPQCNISAKTANGSTVLHLTCESGSFLILKYLMRDCSHHLDLCEVNDSSIGPIHIACQNGRLDIVQYIIGYTMRPHIVTVPDNEGRTPLHLACQSGNTSLVQFLIDDVGCDINVKDSQGQSCVTYASSFGNIDLVHLLVDKYKLDPLTSPSKNFLLSKVQSKNRRTREGTSKNLFQRFISRSWSILDRLSQNAAQT